MTERKKIINIFQELEEASPFYWADINGEYIHIPKDKFIEIKRKYIEE